MTTASISSTANASSRPSSPPVSRVGELVAVPHPDARVSALSCGELDFRMKGRDNCKGIHSSSPLVSSKGGSVPVGSGRYQCNSSSVGNCDNCDKFAPLVLNVSPCTLATSAASGARGPSNGGVAALTCHLLGPNE